MTSPPPNTDSIEECNPERRLRVVRAPSFSPRDLVTNLAVLGEYADLFWTLTAHRIRVRYKQSVLGIGWAVFQPLALMFVYTIIFSVVTRLPSDGKPYALFTFTALLPWTYFSSALTNAATGLVTHRQLISKVYFPREILPLSYVFAALFDFAIGVLLLVPLGIYYKLTITWNMLYAIPILLLLTIFTIDLALILSAGQVRFRDIGLALPLLLQLWMFASPVVYPLSAVPQRLRWAYDLNPLAGLVESFRQAVLMGAPPDARLLGIAAAIALGLLPLAYAGFKYMDAGMADVL